MWEREPLGDFEAFGQAAAQFRARDIEDRNFIFVFDLVHGFILRTLVNPNHMFEVDHFDAHFCLMFAEQVLRIIGAVEINTLGVVARPGVIAAYDKVCAAVVFADQPVPNRFARASHAHRKVQQRHRGGRCRILVQHRLVTAHAGEMIHIARLGQADNRVDQQVGLGFLGGAERQFLMRTVQRVAGLEGHNLAPAHFAEIGAQFVWRVAAGAEIIVHGLLDTGDRTAQVDFARSIMQVVDRRMRRIVRTKHHLGFASLVRHPFVGDGHGGKDHALLVAQRDVLPDGDGLGEIRLHVQRDWHRP